MTTASIEKSHNQKVLDGEVFEFGKNWQQFLTLVTEERIQRAVNTLKQMLDVETLAGKTFLDVGCGSGLFSLAAKRLGAKVFSFDYDPNSVACTKELKKRYFENAGDWEIETGSILDTEYLSRFGKFDVVYSWGVLHHTGAMWQALENIDALVADKGRLFIALYNNQGGASKRWLLIKKIYNALPANLRPLYTFMVYLPLEIYSFLIQLVRLTPQNYFAEIANYKNTSRGMSWWYDKIDWIGGYPFEVSKPEEIFNFYAQRNYQLKKLKTCAGGKACNEFVLQKNP